VGSIQMANSAEIARASRAVANQSLNGRNFARSYWTAVSMRAGSEGAREGNRER